MNDWLAYEGSGSSRCLKHSTDNKIIYYSMYDPKKDDTYKGMVKVSESDDKRLLTDVKIIENASIEAKKNMENNQKLKDLLMENTKAIGIINSELARREAKNNAPSIKGAIGYVQDKLHIDKKRSNYYNNYMKG